MNLTSGTQSGGPLPTLARARFLLLFVEQSIQPVINMAQGSTTVVPEAALVAWQTLLSTVINQLSTLPVPLINPPPRWAQLVNMAITLAMSANQTLAGIPVASLAIFPPRPGQATVSVQTLRQVQRNLRLAAQAVEAAERELGGAGG